VVLRRQHTHFRTLGKDVCHAGSFVLVLEEEERIRMSGSMHADGCVVALSKCEDPFYQHTRREQMLRLGEEGHAASST
jgi:hypothetical protein